MAAAHGWTDISESCTGRSIHRRQRLTVPVTPAPPAGRDLPRVLRRACATIADRKSFVEASIDAMCSENPAVGNI